MTFDTLLISWSIRLSMLLFFATVAIRLTGSARASENAVVKHLWTCGFCFFLVHVLASYHYVHHWSHTEAYAATAKQTLELLGVEVGVGVYFNYLFIAAWALDIANTWFQISTDRWPIQWLLRFGFVYMLFIAFNGVVVFKSGWLRGIGLLCTSILVVAFAAKLFLQRTVETKE